MGYVEMLRSDVTIFPGTKPDVVGEIMRQTEQVEIHDGCGIRPCRMCIVNGKSHGTSMKPDTIFALFEALNRHREQVNIFYVGDPIYYDYNGQTVADILEWGLTNTDLRFYFRTHGFLYEKGDNIVPQRAIAVFRRILEDPLLGKAARDRVQIGFSMDPWGPVGTHNETNQVEYQNHLDRLRRNLIDLADIAPILDSVHAFYNPRDSSTGGIATYNSVLGLTDSVLPDALAGHPASLGCTYQMPHSRSSSIKPSLPLFGQGSGAEPWRGYGIKLDGSIVCSTDGKSPFNVGSIFEPFPKENLQKIYNSLGM